jgi:hypothetical protein
VREPDLDAWLPSPAIRTRHRRSARADPDALWQAAESLRLRDTPALGRAVRWRLPGTPPERSYGELFARRPFIVLDSGAGWSISGLVGRIWTVARDYPTLRDTEEFLRWDRPGTARVLFAHWVEADGPGTGALVSEARVAPVDRRAALRLRALWPLVSGLERLIGGEALRTAARHAEHG